MTSESATEHGAADLRWTRRDTWVLVAIVVACSASLAWLVHPWFDASNDAAIYIQTARAMLAGEGYSYMEEPFIIRPPGWSVLLMPVLALRGVDFAALNLYAGVWGVACAALFFAWVRTRVSTWVALALTALVWLNPGFASLRNQVMSDVPGTAILFGCLLLERWAARRPSLRRELVLGLSIGLGTYVRSMTILLVPAIALARLCERREPRLGLVAKLKSHVAPFALAAIAVQIPWSVRCNAHHPQPPVDQTSLYDYSSGMWREDRGDPSSRRLTASEVLQRVPNRVQNTLVVLGSRMQEDVAGAVNVTLGALFVLALVVNTARRARRETSAELFALAGIAIVLPYFSFQDRLLLPVMIVAWASAAELLESAGRKLLGDARAPILALVPCAVLLAFDARPRGNWDAIRAEHETYRDYCAQLATLVPPSARVAVPQESWRYAIYLDRPVWTLFFGWNRGGGPAGIEQVLDRRRIDTVVVTPFTKPDAAMRPYFVERYGARELAPGIVVAKVR